MASKAGPDSEDRRNPGNTSTNPTGAPAPDPAPGGGNTSPPEEESPEE